MDQDYPESHSTQRSGSASEAGGSLPSELLDGGSSQYAGGTRCLAARVVSRLQCAHPCI